MNFGDLKEFCAQHCMERATITNPLLGTVSLFLTPAYPEIYAQDRECGRLALENALRRVLPYAAQVTIKLASCENCDSENLAALEDDGVLAGIACLECDAMFDPSTLSDIWLEGVSPWAALGYSNPPRPGQYPATPAEMAALTGMVTTPSDVWGFTVLDPETGTGDHEP